MGSSLLFHSCYSYNHLEALLLLIHIIKPLEMFRRSCGGSSLSIHHPNIIQLRYNGLVWMPNDEIRFHQRWSFSKHLSCSISFWRVSFRHTLLLPFNLNYVWPIPVTNLLLRFSFGPTPGIGALSITINWRPCLNAVNCDDAESLLSITYLTRTMPRSVN